MEASQELVNDNGEVTWRGFTLAECADTMTQIHGLSRVLTEMSDRLEPGWIFLKDRSAAFRAENLLTTEYFLADDDDEAIDMEADFAAFLEYPTFRSIMALEKEKGRGDLQSLAEACIYYLEKDDFRP